MAHSILNESAKSTLPFNSIVKQLPTKMIQYIIYKYVSSIQFQPAKLHYEKLL